MRTPRTKTREPRRACCVTLCAAAPQRRSLPPLPPPPRVLFKFAEDQGQNVRTLYIVSGWSKVRARRRARDPQEQLARSLLGLPCSCATSLRLHLVIITA